MSKQDLKICRLCSEAKGATYLFNSNNDFKLSDKIMYFCVNVTVREGDGLPSHICDECEYQLSFCYQFVLKCEESDKKLRTNIELNSPFDYSDFHDETQVDVDVKKEIHSFNALGNNILKDDAIIDFVEPLIEHSQIEVDFKTDPGYLESSNKLVCSECGLVCQDKHKLSAHKRIHITDKLYACSLCDKKYKDKGTLNRHIERNHSDTRERKFVCEVCGKRFFNKSDVIAHNRTHTGETPYNCPLCDLKFSQKGAMLRHKRRHTGHKPYLCSTCSKNFSTKEELKCHLQVHSTEKHECSICNALFKFKNNLNKHMKLHSDSKRFVCNHCGHRCNSKGNLQKHINSMHSEKSGHCDICYKNVPNIEVHHRKHTGERPLQCNMCLRSFKEQSGLTHHINFCHKNGCKFKCSYEGCDELFPTKPMLDFHEAKLHSTNIPFPCDRCSKGFYRKNDLSRHKIASHKLMSNETKLTVR